MSITSDELIDDPTITHVSEPSLNGGRPRVTSWVNELPRATRTSEYDDAMDEVRQGAPGQWAVIEGADGKPLTPNRIASLKKRYPDITFKLVRGVAYASPKG
jgi:hypothetical protein